jgi:transcriptional regulator with XRE-family HTH domain
MVQAVPTSSTSASLVSYLRGQGKTLRQIGEMVGLSESFISRVAKGDRSFTLDHLSAFERELGEPLPALLLQSMRPRSLSARQQTAFDEALQLMREIGEFRHSLARGKNSEVSASSKNVPQRAAARKRSRAAG